MKISIEGNSDELKEFFNNDKDEDVQVKEVKFESKQAMKDFLDSILRKGGK